MFEALSTSSNIQKNTHTQVELLPDTAEYTFSKDFFFMIDAAGYCMFYRSVPDFINWIHEILNEKTISPITERARNELLNFNFWYRQLPENIEYVCIFPQTPLRATTNTVIDEIKRASLQNHERLHALTMRLHEQWYYVADEILIHRFGTFWFQLSDEVINIKHHTSIREAFGDVWVGISESLARIAAILHTDPKYRKIIASYQINRHSKLLYKFAIEFEKAYGSVENFIEIVDRRCHYQFE